MERRPSATDRRLYALHFDEGREAGLGVIGQVACEHHRSLLASLSEEERASLAAMLSRIAEQQGLTPGVHPGSAGVATQRTTRRFLGR